MNVEIANVMNVDHVNEALLGGNIDRAGVFPRLEALSDAAVVFRVSFGLDTLPTEPGVLVIRGPRQYGKSTWLEGALRDTIREFGAGSALYLDGEEGGPHIEVKRGAASPMEFGWFRQVFPKANLQVVCATPFESDAATGLTLETFLRG